MIEEMRRGAVANLPVGASVAAYGSVLGMLAAQKGLTWPQLLAMNLSVFAGSAQFVMVEMWAPPLPVVEMTLAVMIINMRYLLIGASLNPLFRGKAMLHKAGIMHLVADENWAVTMAACRCGGGSAGGPCRAWPARAGSAWTTIPGLFTGASPSAMPSLRRPLSFRRRRRCSGR